MVSVFPPGSHLPVWRVQAQIPTFINTGHILINAIDSLQNTSGQTFKFTEFIWLFGTVVFQIINAIIKLECTRSGQCNTVHFRQFACTRGTVEVCRSVEDERIFFIRKEIMLRKVGKRIVNQLILECEEYSGC